MRRQISEAFGKAVRQVLESRQGMSIRAADRRTGINHVSIGRMAEGYIPEMETVVRWARGFNLDVNEWLRLAGYDPLGTETPQQRFWAPLRRGPRPAGRRRDPPPGPGVRPRLPRLAEPQ